MIEQIGRTARGAERLDPEIGLLDHENARGAETIARDGHRHRDETMTPDAVQRNQGVGDQAIRSVLERGSGCISYSPKYMPSIDCFA